MSTLPKLIGILNITPDAFSDGGLYTQSENALTHAKKLIKQGADVIDLGAESTGPNAKEISHEQEWERLEPILNILQPLRKKAELSVDSRHSKTVKKSLDIGVDWINDVSGFSQTDMVTAIKNSTCKVVIMHNLGIPADKKTTISPAQDPVNVVYEWAEDKILSMVQQGVEKSRIIFDPGIGFGKSAEQSMVLVQSAHCFKMLGVPLYYGHSRKSFLSLISPHKKANQRDEETNTISAFLYKQGVDYLRVHDIKSNLRAIKQARQGNI